jgi:hypothetical protein
MMFEVGKGDRATSSTTMAVRAVSRKTCPGDSDMVLEMGNPELQLVRVVSGRRPCGCCWPTGPADNRKSGAGRKQGGEALDAVRRGIAAWVMFNRPTSKFSTKCDVRFKCTEKIVGKSLWAFGLGGEKYIDPPLDAD